jgi:hypothetical protein
MNYEITTEDCKTMSDFEKTRINMAYNFYCEELKKYEQLKKQSGCLLEVGYEKYVAENAVRITDTLLKALGYEEDEE